MTDAIRETLIDLLNKYDRDEMDRGSFITEVERLFPPTENGIKEPYKLDNN